MTDDPSEIDSTLAQYGDIVYPDKNSIVHRYSHAFNLFKVIIFR